MSLIMPIFVNEDRIGSIIATRRSAAIEGQPSQYDWKVNLNAHRGRPKLELENNPDEPVEHYYDDGALVLIQKVIEAAEVFA